MKIVRPIAINDTGSFTRASTASYYDKNGAIQIAAINVPRFGYNPLDLSEGPSLLIEAAATNLVLNSATLVTQNVTVVDGQYTLSFDGSGTVDLSGASVGTLVGGATRSTFTFTATAGTLTLTVTGACTNAQLELGSVSTSYIPTTGSTVTRAADVNTSGMLSPLPENEYSTHNTAKIYNIGERVQVAGNGVHKIFESAVGAQSVVTLNASGAVVVTWAGHGQVKNTPISFVTTGALPSPMVAGTVYYVSNILDANTFNISAAVNGNTFSIVGAGSGVHTATASLNYNKPPLTNPSMWLDAGSTNPWAMYDLSIESQTSAADALIAVVPTPLDSLVDSVVMQNIENAIAGRVRMVDPVEGVVYDRTVSLVSDSAIDDWYLWFTEPIERITDFALTDLPPYAASSVTVSLIGPGSTVKCGLCVLGMSKTFGPTQAGMALSIQDYSKKSKDEFGLTRFEEGAYAKTMTMTVWVDNKKVDVALNTLNKFRAVPIVYIGDEEIRSSIQFGTYKDYTNGVDYPDVSTLHLEIESLT